MTDNRCLNVGKAPRQLRTLVSSLSATCASMESDICLMHRAETDGGTFLRISVPIPAAAATHSTRAGHRKMDARSTGAHPVEISYVCSIARLTLLCLGQSVRGGRETLTRQKSQRSSGRRTIELSSMPIGLTPFSRRILFGATLFCSLMFLPRSSASFGTPVPNGTFLAPNGRVVRNPVGNEIAHRPDMPLPRR